MKFTLSIISLLATGAAAAGVPRPSVASDKKEGITISVKEDVVDNIRFQDLSQEGSKRRRRQQRRLNGGKGKNADTAAPTETPLFFFSAADFDDSIITDMLGDFTDFKDGEPADVPCINGVCQGEYKAIITGEPLGGDCQAADIGVACIVPPCAVTITCPDPFDKAFLTEIACVDTTALDPLVGPLDCPFGAAVATEAGAGAVYNILTFNIHAQLEIICCPAA